MKLNINIDEIVADIHRFDKSVTTPIAYGTLKDGRKYQVQVTITTNEDDFIERDGIVDIKTINP